jgi:hypothetical protein
MAAGFIIMIAFVVVIYSLPIYTPGVSPTGGTSDQNTSSGTSGGINPTEAVNQANEIKAKADLKAIQTQLMAYYSEQGTYPGSLEELASHMGTVATTSNMIFTSCSDQSAVIYHNSSGYPGYVFNYEQVASSNGSPPSCP